MVRNNGEIPTASNDMQYNVRLMLRVLAQALCNACVHARLDKRLQHGCSKSSGSSQVGHAGLATGG